MRDVIDVILENIIMYRTRLIMSAFFNYLRTPKIYLRFFVLHFVDDSFDNRLSGGAVNFETL